MLSRIYVRDVFHVGGWVDTVFLSSEFEGERADGANRYIGGTVDSSMECVLDHAEVIFLDSSSFIGVIIGSVRLLRLIVCPLGGERRGNLGREREEIG